MSEPEKKADFNSIRAEVEKIQKTYGGRINIEQWFSKDEECLKVVMTWKKTAPVTDKDRVGGYVVPNCI